MRRRLAGFSHFIVARHPAVLVSAALLLVAIAVASVPSARAVAGRLITGHDIQDGSITNADLSDGSVNSHKIQNGHVLSRDLSRGLRARIARHAKTGAKGAAGAPGAAGPAGPAGAGGKDGSVGPAGKDGQPGASVTSDVIPVGDPRCASGRGGVAYTLGNQTVPVCNGADGTSDAETTVQLTATGAGWTSHASATRDPNGLVHLVGSLDCLGTTGCDALMVTLPAGYQAAPVKQAFPLLDEDPFSHSYQNLSAFELTGDALSISSDITSTGNGQTVWVSGITYKAVS
jgi:hypothetical protein